METIEAEIIKNNEPKKLLKEGKVFWFTGLSGAGKTTLADLMNVELISQGLKSIILDGDIIRKGLNKDLKFSNEDRLENNRRIAEVAKILLDSNFVVFVSCISPFQNDRNFIREIFQDKQFFEIYIECPISICEERDVKGLYKKARLGLIERFTGIDSPYEIPTNPDLVVQTHQNNIEFSSQTLLNFILKVIFGKI